MTTTRTEAMIGLLLAGVFALAGLAMMAAGTFIHRERERLLAGGRSAKGTIVELERVGGGPGDPLKETWLVPVVEFSTDTGDDITFQADTSTPWWTDYNVGSTVEVVYDPQDPRKARIDGFAEIWFAPLMFWLVGAGAVFVPTLTMWRHLRASRART